jgi:CTP:molybdopterin cytidylyltransferase MocA
MRSTVTGISAMTNPSLLVGIVLAAGQGTRMGSPKALLRDDAGTPWLEIATTRMLNSGCDTVFVVLGASATAARALLPVDSRIIPLINPRFASGISHSLRAGLQAADQTAAIAAMVTLLDLPRMPASVVSRVLYPAGGADFVPLGPTTLRRAVYGGIPGHPALIGRAHWDALQLTLRGDSGALRYLIEHHALEVECGDLFDGRDSDVPANQAAPEPGSSQLDGLPDQHRSN